MRSMLRAGIAAAALWGWSSASIAASNCLSEQEGDALHTASVQQQLMVASASCGKDLASYGRFVQRYQTDLRISDATLIAFFNRHNVQTGEADFQTFKTKLAYIASLRDSREHRNFCLESGQMLDRLLHAAISLDKFAATQPVAFEMPYVACTGPSLPADPVGSKLQDTAVAAKADPAIYLATSNAEATRRPLHEETQRRDPLPSANEALISELKASALNAIKQQHTTGDGSLALLHPRSVPVDPPQIAIAAPPSIFPKMKPFVLDGLAETADRSIARRPARARLRWTDVTVDASVVPRPKPFWLSGQPRWFERSEADRRPRNFRWRMAEFRQPEHWSGPRNAYASPEPPEKARHRTRAQEWTAAELAEDDRHRSAYLKSSPRSELVRTFAHESRLASEARTRASDRPVERPANNPTNDFASLLARLTGPSVSTPSIATERLPKVAVQPAVHANPATAAAVPDHNGPIPVRATARPHAATDTYDESAPDNARDDRSSDLNLAQNDAYDSYGNDEGGFDRYRPRARRHWRRQYFSSGGWDPSDGERYGAYAARNDEDEGEGSSDDSFEYGRDGWQ
jgi:hypothetical protein